MKRLGYVYVLATLLLLLLGSRGAQGHKCIFDRVNPPPSQSALGGMSKKHTTMRLVNTVNNPQPIRIQLYTDALNPANDVGYSCAAAGDVVSVNGASYTCTANDVLSSAKLDYLTNTLLQTAKTTLQETLNVDRLATNLTFGSGVCSSISLPASYQSPGVAADIVLLITARPINEASVLAFGKNCISDGTTGRQILGQLNFDPSTVVVDQSKYYYQLGVAIHEISHVLGFSLASFQTAGIVQSYQKTITSDGSTSPLASYMITSPNVQQFITSHFGCPSMTGAELEDQGGSGTASSHWEKRIFNNEYMTGTASNYPVFSNLTLALFADLGYYTVSYQHAEQLVWGYGLNCTFSTGKCSQWGNSLLYCTDSSAGDQCTYDRTAIGTCSISSETTPSYYTWVSGKGGDQLPDYCPSYDGYSNRFCMDPTQTDSDIINTGEVFGAGSRCFTSSLLKTTPISVTSAPRCFTTACQAAGKLKVKVSSYYYDCPFGQSISVEGYGGELQCPPKAGVLCINDPTDNSWPIFETIEPSSGGPGTEITITGQNFFNVSINIYDKYCTDINLVNSTFLTAVMSDDYVDPTSILASKQVNVYIINGNGYNDVGIKALSFQITLNEAYAKKIAEWAKQHWYVIVIGCLVVIGIGIFFWRCCCAARKTNSFSRKSQKM